MRAADRLSSSVAADAEAAAELGRAAARAARGLAGFNRSSPFNRNLTRSLAPRAKAPATHAPLESNGRAYSVGSRWSRILRGKARRVGPKTMIRKSIAIAIRRGCG